MTLSIIIVNYNTEALLKRCLCSILATVGDLDYEAIVIDNASADGSGGMVARDFPAVHLIRNSTNRGFGAANNQAIKVARGKYILLLNSDTEVLPGALQESIRFLDVHPEASILGCRLLNDDRSLQTSVMAFPSPWNLFCEASFLYIPFRRTRLFGGYYVSYFDYDRPLRVDIVKGAFMMVRREVFDRVGLFDESYFMYTEETDLCWRARQHGLDAYFIPTAEIIHSGGGSVESNERFLRQLHMTQAFFIRKNFTGFRKFSGLALKIGGMALRVPVYLGVGVLTADRSLIRKSGFYAHIAMELLR
jgi:GT2 family glycosyltransferase